MPNKILTVEVLILGCLPFSEVASIIVAKSLLLKVERKVAFRLACSIKPEMLNEVYSIICIHHVQGTEVVLELTLGFSSSKFPSLTDYFNLTPKGPEKS